MLRTISINPVLNGFIVQCGCQQLAYTSIDEMIDDLGSYYRNPEETEKRILQEKGINRKHTLREETVPQPATDCCNGTAGVGINPWGREIPTYPFSKF